MSGVPTTCPGTCYSCNVLVRSAANGLQCSYSTGQHFLFPLLSKLGETLHILHMTWMVTVKTLFNTMKMHFIINKKPRRPTNLPKQPENQTRRRSFGAPVLLWR